MSEDDTAPNEGAGPDGPPAHGEGRHWLDNPGNVDRIFYGLVILAGIAFLGEFFYEFHGEFSFQGWFGFYAIFGFAAYCAIVLSAKELRKLIKRPEDYYDR